MFPLELPLFNKVVAVKVIGLPNVRFALLVTTVPPKETEPVLPTSV